MGSKLACTHWPCFPARAAAAAATAAECGRDVQRQTPHAIGNA